MYKIQFSLNKFYKYSKKKNISQFPTSYENIIHFDLASIQIHTMYEPEFRDIVQQKQHFRKKKRQCVPYCYTMHILQHRQTHKMLRQQKTSQLPHTSNHHQIHHLLASITIHHQSVQSQTPSLLSKHLKLLSLHHQSTKKHSSPWISLRFYQLPLSMLLSPSFHT